MEDIETINHTHQEMIIPIQCIVIVLLVIIILILVIYIAIIKWMDHKRRCTERTQCRTNVTNTVYHQTPSDCMISIADLQKRANENVKALPAYFPEDKELGDIPSPGYGPCDEDIDVQGNKLRRPPRQLDLITPGSCGSGRIDSELTELLKTDMTESVTVEVDSKLLMFISKEIDDMGGTLALDKMGVTLFIPPCAIPRGKKQIIQLVLDWDLSDFPPMKDTQTIISPVVHCGPHGLKLAKPAILSFMHCADDIKDIMVLSSETHLTQEKQWKPLQRRKKGGKVEYELLENQCQVYLSHFSLYTSIAEGSNEKSTKKWIQLAAFGKKEGGQFQVFIYMLNNTPCALQFATQQQAKYNCSMLRCPLEFLMDEEGGDLVFDLKHVSEGWNPVGRKWEDFGLLPDIWKEKCNNVSFTFKHDNPACTDLNFSMCLFQKNMADVKRHFEVALSFPNKSPTMATQLHSTNLNVNLTQGLSSIVTKGFEDGPSSTLSEKTYIKSTGCDKAGYGPDHLTNDDENTDYNDNDDVDKRDKGFSSKLEGNQGGTSSMMETSSLGNHSRRTFEIPNSTNTTNINIHTELVQPSASVGHNDFPKDGPTVVFPLRLRSKLVALLDPPSPVTSLVNDWRVLAESLKMDSLVNLIRTKTSPTEELLDVAAQKGKDCRWLFGVLREAERYDAADEVAKYLDDDSESMKQKSNETNISETPA